MRRHRAGKVGIAFLALSLMPAPPAAARTVEEVVDLRTAPSWHAGDASRIGPVGDVNGDGLDDVAIADCGAGESAGEVRVVWGPLEPEDVTFDDAGAGFSIRGAQPKDTACRLPAHAVGDVNGDGMTDVLVGADRHYRAPATVYVVFGKTGSEPVDLRAFDDATQESGGYVVPRWNGSNLGIAGLGDMNQDGLADFAVGADDNTYVVFGQSSTTPVDLSTFDLGEGRGFLIRNRCRECFFGYAGDVNGDGVPDVGVGGVPWRMYETPGAAYVVFGKADSAPVNVRTRTPQSFKIKADTTDGMRDGTIAAAGDVNGDGLGDAVIGMSRVGSCCHGEAVIVFGKTGSGTVRLAELGDGGFRILASEEHDFFGYAVAGIGDVNRDGLDDVAVGAPGHDYPGRGGPGAVYVLYGKESSSTLRTGNLGDRGFTIVGREHIDWTGTALGVPGDMNDDGVPDLMIAAVSGAEVYLLWL